MAKASGELWTALNRVGLELLYLDADERYGVRCRKKLIGFCWIRHKLSGTSARKNLDEASGANDVSTIGSSDAKSPDYYGEKHITTSSYGNIAHIIGVDTRAYEHSSISQPEALKSEPSETAQENKYSFPSSSHKFTYENAQQPDLTYPHLQTSSHI